MANKGLFVALLGLVLLLAVGGFLFIFLRSRRDTGLQALIDASRGNMRTRSSRGSTATDQDEEVALSQIKKQTRKSLKKSAPLTKEERFFQAGMFAPSERRDFRRLEIFMPIVACPVFALIALYIDKEFVVYGLFAGLIFGFWIPGHILNRRIKQRSEEIMYFLPLVIEQIAIGVSSSLDIGPCVQRVVQMADERDSHNVVTEMLRHCEYHVKSGVSLDDALQEVGIKSGHTELKHVFMSLAQVSRHGGEITKQLQELADSVSSQRETQIEGKIKKLELEATGPVALVFLGFLFILFSGFFIQIREAFG